VPVLGILPQIVVELVTYGLVAGVLHEKLSMPVVWSLLGAMIGGRLALFLSMLLIYLILGESYSPLRVETSPILSLWSVVKQGWPGIVIQLVSIPTAVWLVGKLSASKDGSRH
jgi:hypothetical protein